MKYITMKVKFEDGQFSYCGIHEIMLITVSKYLHMHTNYLIKKFVYILTPNEPSHI